MKDNILKTTVVESFHQDYFHIAIESYQACKQREGDIWYLDRNIIDTILYSYATIEAVTEYINDMAENNQLRIKLPHTWLTRHLSDIWEMLKLSHKIGILAYTWTDARFWESAKQYQLFEDLQTIRNRLTHVKIYKTSEKKKIVESYSLDNGIEGYKAENIFHVLETQCFLTNKKSKAIAQFQNHPRKLTSNDAGQSLEIMIWHVLKFEQLFGFIRGELTTFHPVSSREIMTVDEILDLTGRQFESSWTEC